MRSRGDQREFLVKPIVPKRVENQGCTRDEDELNVKAAYGSGLNLKSRQDLSLAFERHDFKGNMRPFREYFGRYGWALRWLQGDCSLTRMSHGGGTRTSLHYDHDHGDHYQRQYRSRSALKRPPTPHSSTSRCPINTHRPFS